MNAKNQSASACPHPKIISPQVFSAFLAKWGIPIFLFVLTFMAYFWINGGERTPYDQFVRLADAVLHGKLDFEKRGGLEMALFEGKYYVIPPPLPAILILPAVAFFGTAFNQTLASLLFGSLNVVLAYFTAFKLTGRRSTAIWLAILFGFGTIHWWITIYGGVWTFSQTIAVTFLFLAVYEMLTRKRPFLIGLFLGAAYWCRLPTVLTLPFFIIMLWEQWYKPAKGAPILKGIRFKPLLLLFAGLAFFVLLNFAYNYARFHTIFDVAYSLRKNIQLEPQFKQGLLNIDYIPRHLDVIFTKLPSIIDTFPYLKPRKFGLAIWFTTPAFIYSLFGYRRKQLFIASWLGIICTALLLFSHGSTGVLQFGYRFAVDFYPLLFLLTVIGIGKSPAWHARLLMIVSIMINLWGMVSIYKLNMWG